MFNECFRVIKPTGSVVFNLGDKYLKGNLQLLPYRFAIKVLDTTGAILVNNVTWIKRNPTPRQTKRRLISSTEPFFHFAKDKSYYYDLDRLLPEDHRHPEPRVATKIGQGYFGLIDKSDLTADEKDRARRDLGEAIEAVKTGECSGLRMLIRGVHPLAYGGYEGGRNTQILKNGYTIIRLRGLPMRRDVFESAVECIPGIKHPAVFPRSIVENFLKLTTREGDTVLDPFLGSGTTAVACVAMNRQFIGFDLNSEYVALAKERLAGLNIPSSVCA
jgi:DNA modification methylase